MRRRPIASAAAVVALLASFFSGFDPRPGGDGAAAGMKCCRKSKTCCKRSNAAMGQTGPRYTAAPECGNRCGQSIVVPTSPTVALATGRVEAGRVVEEPLLRQHVASTDRAGAEFALFERPPPSI